MVSPLPPPYDETNFVVIEDVKDSSNITVIDMM
jgi:hypothetical protein